MCTIYEMYHKTTVADAENLDLVMPTYNLIGYSLNSEKKKKKKKKKKQEVDSFFLKMKPQVSMLIL